MRHTNFLKKTLKTHSLIGKKVIAAWYDSRGIAYINTTYYGSWLNFGVQNETRCVPTALTAITTILFR